MARHIYDSLLNPTYYNKPGQSPYFIIPTKHFELFFKKHY